MATSNVDLDLLNAQDFVSVDPINNNFEKVDAQLADAIIARGASGDWWYRKYRSGRYECGVEFKWFAKSNLTNVNNAYGISGEYTFGNYPITFVGRPYCNITFEDENGGGYAKCFGWIAMNKMVSRSTSPTFKVCIDRGKAPIKPACGIHVIGRWK